MAGAYFVTAAALDGPRQGAAVIDDVQLRFNVVSTGGESGLVRLDHRWSLDVTSDRLGRADRTRGAAQ